MFKSELAAGKLNEQRPKVGDLRAILDLDEADSDDDGEEDAVMGASEDVEDTEDKDLPANSPSAQPNSPPTNDSPPFARIPGPQNIVRMPYINWDTYHITGEPLDQLHEQQRRWPGSVGYGQDRGREQVVAAPYSPWLDTLDGQQRMDLERRHDSISTPITAITPTTATTVSEHPMETRRGGGR